MYQWLNRAFPKERNETGVWWRCHDVKRHQELDRRRHEDLDACIHAGAAAGWAAGAALRSPARRFSRRR
jgi:hypothetical protein